MIETLACNASPVIFLARIDRLSLLADIAPKVILPRSVMSEVDAGNDIDGAGDVARKASFLEIVSDVSPTPSVAAWQLGAGETQVLSLAVAMPGVTAVIDDLAARKCAKTLGVSLLGTISVLAIAKKKALIPAIAPLLHALREEGMRLSPSLVEQILGESGE